MPQEVFAVKSQAQKFEVIHMHAWVHLYIKHILTYLEDLRTATKVDVEELCRGAMKYLKLEIYLFFSMISTDLVTTTIVRIVPFKRKRNVTEKF